MKINKKKTLAIVGISEEAQERIKQESKKHNKKMYEYVNDLVLKKDGDKVTHALDILIRKVDILAANITPPQRKSWFGR